MSRNLVCIKVEECDKNKMMAECKKLFLENNPKMEGIHLTQVFMFKKIVRYYLEN